MKKIMIRFTLLFAILFLLTGCEPEDIAPPSITLTGDNIISIEVGGNYQEQGATCQDDIDTSCHVTIDDSNLDINHIGSYEITYIAHDSSNNTSNTVNRTIQVVDTTAPVIEITGNNVVHLEVNETYRDLGATCTDNYDSTCLVSVDVSHLFTSVIGSYMITYTATDASSNEAIQVVRTVIVEDTTNPTIELIGDQTIEVNVFDDYVDLGAICTDNFDVNCTLSIDDSNVNTNMIGSYYVLYTATDSSGNKTTQTLRTINVVDEIAPVIEMLGQSTLYIAIDEDYIDFGAFCTDNYDEACTVTIDSSTLNTSLKGIYTISYTAVDASNNVANEMIRTIVVQDTQDRVLTLSYDDVVYHLVNQPWEYPTINVPLEGEYYATGKGYVDPTTEGTYIIEYTVTDELDNIYLIRMTVYVVNEIPDETLFLDLENMYNISPSVFSILREFDVNGDFFLDTNEVSSVTNLNLSGKNINNLHFLTYFSNLTSLNVDKNNLYDLDFIQDLEHLETLSASENFLESSDLCALSLLDITSLDISDNYIIDLECLNSLTSLNELNANSNIISSIELTGSIERLTKLDIGNNPITSLDDILVFTNLTELDINNTFITNIYYLDILSKLQVVTLPESIDNYYILDYLYDLSEVHIPQLDADLELSFFFDYLMTYGITVSTKSMTSFDLVSPNIILFEESLTITLGETFDYNTLNYIVYDYYDLYITDQPEASIPDTSILTPGTHSITLSFTDADGNTSTVLFEIQVLEDYDLANVVIFIRFEDESEYSSLQNFSFYQELFNGTELSLKDYYLEVSNNEFNITTLFPSSEIVFFTDSHSRAYYQPYHATNNPDGYEDENEGYYREQELLTNAIEWADEMNLFSDDDVLDYDNDGIIDVITFLVYGHVDDWSDLLWPHMYSLYESTDGYGDFYTDAPSINGTYAYDYTFQLIGDNEEASPYFDLATFTHEMFHIIGAPDLYHYYSDDDIDATGYWGLMSSTYSMPAHMLGYMKEAYGGWDQDEIIVSTSGTYVLNRTTLETDNLLVIDLEYSNEYLYLEYRTATGDYEINLPSEGLLVYRVDEDYYPDGNIYGYYDESYIAQEEVYIFRDSTFDNTILANENTYIIVDDGDPDSAALTLDGVTSVGLGTTIPLFFSDGSVINITITILDEDADTVTVQITINE